MACPVEPVSRVSAQAGQMEAMQGNQSGKLSERARVRLAVALMVSAWALALAWGFWGLALVLAPEPAPESSACLAQAKEPGPEMLASASESAGKLGAASVPARAKFSGAVDVREQQFREKCQATATF